MGINKGNDGRGGNCSSCIGALGITMGLRNFFLCPQLQEKVNGLNTARSGIKQNLGMRENRFWQQQEHEVGNRGRDENNKEGMTQGIKIRVKGSGAFQPHLE